MDKNPVYKESFFLTAGESNARGEMPMTLIAERMIEVATGHANHLEIGYDTLNPLGVGWVLSRLGVEMVRTPKINEHYNVTTWIESWNRLFSERCFKFTDKDGNLFGWGRTIWATIDFATRKAADLSGLCNDIFTSHGMVCEMPRMRNHGVVAPTYSEALTFRYSDIDFNRHVNSVRYIEHILNLWPLSHYDACRLDRFEIAYRHECFAGDEVTLNADMSMPFEGRVDIVREGERAVTSVLRFTPDPFIK